MLVAVQSVFVVVSLLTSASCVVAFLQQPPLIVASHRAGYQRQGQPTIRSDGLQQKQKPEQALSSQRHYQQTQRLYQQQQPQQRFFARRSLPFLLYASETSDDDTALSSSSSPVLKRVPPELEGVPLPFVDKSQNSFIECYADSVASIDGVEYTIGVPCDYCVALCYYDTANELVPVELDDEELMNDVYPVAEQIVEEEFGEELVLQRTPQTLTLVGELEEDEEEEDEEDVDEEEEDDDDVGVDGVGKKSDGNKNRGVSEPKFVEDDTLTLAGNEDDDEDDEKDDEEEVEVLLSFEHRGKEFSLVRLLDPILLVGKADESNPDNRILLTPEESNNVMPLLEDMFLSYHDDPDDLLP